MSVKAVIFLCSLCVLLTALTFFLLVKNKSLISFFRGLSENHLTVMILWGGFFVVISFFTLRGINFKVYDGIGQIGDFVGGLINPILSFAAFIVLIRSNRFQIRSAMRTNYQLRKQNKELRSDRFRAEFYSLLKHVEDYAQNYIRGGKFDAFDLSNIYGECNHALKDITGKALHRKAKKIVLESIENTVFERFSLAVRRVIKHIESEKMRDWRRDQYMDILMDALTVQEKTVLLDWAFFKWRVARKWLRKYPVSKGIPEGDFIIDCIPKYFNLGR